MNSDQGILQVNVYNETIALPIENATVRIFTNDYSELLFEEHTDSSGQTPSVFLKAPPLEYSMEFGMPKPYDIYALTINADGFEPVYITGVQLLPLQTALQNVFMTPIVLDDFEAGNIDIYDHTLWGIFPPKIPEDEVKPLPDSGGLVVLPEPVIPEYVIVNLGPPSNPSAEKVWIPYKDYIKNVASSEIYSTWPIETIKANVLAINSFVLNRVYTEWYRGRGYEFTITNSTAYDQEFVYGRNIYDEISVVVDELFSTYITRPNIAQDRKSVV